MKIQEVEIRTRVPKGLVTPSALIYCIKMMWKTRKLERSDLAIEALSECFDRVKKSQDGEQEQVCVIHGAKVVTEAVVHAVKVGKVRKVYARVTQFYGYPSDKFLLCMCYRCPDRYMCSDGFTAGCYCRVCEKAAKDGGIRTVCECENRDN